MTSKLKSTSKRSQRFPNRGVALWARFPPVKKKPGENKKKPRARLFSPRVRIITVFLKCSLSAQYQVMMREKGRVVETVGTLG